MPRFSIVLLLVAFANLSVDITRLVLEFYPGEDRITHDVPVPSVGSTVTPRVALNAQKTPPNFFGQSGPRVQVLKPKERYIILQEKSYPSLSGNRQKWLQVAPFPNESTETKPQNSFWIYYGREGSFPANLEPCDAACLRGRNGQAG